ncbi:hypothetical protein [Actinophytocola sp. KF-1]
MGELLRSAFESVVTWSMGEKDEDEVERVLTRVRLWVFLAAAAVMSLLFIAAGGVWGWTVATVPLGLVLVTRRFGIEWLPAPVFWFAGAVVVIPAVFLGIHYSDTGVLSGFLLVGYLVFFLWVTVYPSVLTDAEQHHARTNFGPGVVIRDEAEYRILVLTLWMATATMIAVGASTAAVVCFLALGWVARWTAAIAAVACLADALLTFGAGGFAWKDTEPFAFVVAAVAGLLAASDWVTAVRHPTWSGRGWLRVLRPLLRRFV